MMRRQCTISLKKGKRIALDHVGMFADGVAVRQVGQETFRLCKKFVDDVILVSVDEISAAVKDIFDDTRTVMEPSGALAVGWNQEICLAKWIKDLKI